MNKEQDAYNIAVNTLSDYYSDKVLKGLARDIWIGYLKLNLQPKEVMQGVVKCIIQERYLPTPQEFISLAKGYGEEEAAIKAWEKIEDWYKSHNSLEEYSDEFTKSIFVDELNLNKVKLSTLSAGEYNDFKKKFINAYNRQIFDTQVGKLLNLE